MSRKPNTQFASLITAAVGGVIFLTVVWLAWPRGTERPEGTQSATAQPERSEFREATKHEVAVALNNGVIAHKQKFPATWAMDITDETPEYEIDQGWFDFCREGEVMKVANLFRLGRMWVNSTEGDFDITIKAPNNLLYRMNCQREDDSIAITVSVL